VDEFNCKRIQVVSQDSKIILVHLQGSRFVLESVSKHVFSGFLCSKSGYSKESNECADKAY
jgi:hypothetical protein